MTSAVEYIAARPWLIVAIVVACIVIVGAMDGPA